MASENSSTSPPEDVSETKAELTTLSDAQRARIERNRQKALLLKQARLGSRPYSLQPPDKSKAKVKSVNKTVDTGAGFFLEEEDQAESRQVNVVHPKAPLLGSDFILCEECGKDFMESYLFDKFDLSVCDNCRDNDEKHKLMTKSDAKDLYLLKDVDLERREPILKFILKKNPRNDRWGDMKLYLASQVHQRAMEVWGSEEKIEEQKELKAENREKVKQKRFDKKVKDLRMAVRSSLWTKDTGSHEHVYGPETYNEAEDTYTKTCTTCSHQMSYEKM